MSHVLAMAMATTLAKIGDPECYIRPFLILVEMRLFLPKLPFQKADPYTSFLPTQSLPRNRCLTPVSFPDNTWTLLTSV
jgi:hypothetical protein